MGYQVRKKGNSFSLYDVKDLGSEKKREQRYIRKTDSEFKRLGFNRDMTFEEARSLARSISADKELKRLEEKRVKLDQRRREANLIECAYLPLDLVTEFEKTLPTRKIRVSHWETAKKLIRKWAKPPTDWKEDAASLFSLFEGAGYSLDYTNTIRRAINEWGSFYCKKRALFFELVKAPTGADKSKIILAYEAAGKGRKRPSGRLSFSLLQQHRGKFSTREHNWLFIQIAFGLRPEEMEKSITDPTKHAIKSRDGKTYLFAYQWKLERTEPNPAKRWKKIEVVLPEQHKALGLLRLGEFKRPKRKSLEGLMDNRGRKLTHYCGRKEFFPSMCARGFDELRVSKWLGHRDPATARKHYDDPFDDSPFSFDEVG